MWEARARLGSSRIGQARVTSQPTQLHTRIEIETHASSATRAIRGLRTVIAFASYGDVTQEARWRYGRRTRNR